MDPAYARMTKARGAGQPRASEAKGPLPGEEGWVMEKKKKKNKRVKAYNFNFCSFNY